MIKKCFFLILSFVMFSLCAEAKNLYVNNSGSPVCSDSTTYDNNSETSPWCTLLRAVRGNSDGNRNTAGVSAQAAQAGDTVYVAAGTYNYTGPSYTGPSFLSTFYDPINSGTSEAWITFQAVGAVELRGNITNGASTFGSNTANYIKWIGFTVNQAYAGFRNGLVSVTTDHVWLEGNTIIGQYTDWGYHDNHPGIMVHGPRSGDCIGGIGSITIKNNNIYGWVGNNSRNDAGITLYCLGDDILIENNEIHSNKTGINAKSSYVDNENIVIRYNYFYDNSGDAIAMQAFSDWYVYQNIMRDNSSGFLFFCTNYYVGNVKPNDVHIVNNTMDGNRSGIYFKSNCSNLNNNFVYNNLITNSQYAITPDNEQCQSMSNMGVDDVHFNYNLYDYSGHFYEDTSTFANWKSSYGQDANSVDDVDPLYIDESVNDFKVQVGSPARTLGRTITAIHGSSGQIIPAGAYITGNEVIGIEGGESRPPSAPRSLGIVN